MGLASLAHARIMPIRPIVLASGANYSVVAAGTITTSGNTSAIIGWNATVTFSNRIARYHSQQHFQHVLRTDLL